VFVAAWIALVQVKKSAKGLGQGGLRGDRDTRRLGLRDPVANATRTGAIRMVQEEQDEVVNMEPVQWWRPSQ
jgi:hypothetical protein